MALARTATNVAKAGIITSASISGAGVLSYVATGAGVTSIVEGLGSLVAFGESIPVIGSLSTAITSGMATLGNGLAGMLGAQATGGAMAMQALLAASPLMAAGLGIALIAVGVAAVWGISKWLNRTGDKIDHKIEERKAHSKQQSQERGQAHGQEQSRGTAPTTERIAQKEYDFGDAHPAIEAERKGKVWANSAAVLPPSQQISGAAIG